jgi:hypothetical protein
MDYVDYTDEHRDVHVTTQQVARDTGRSAAIALVKVVSARRLVQARWVHADGDNEVRGAIYRVSEDGTVPRLTTGGNDRAHEVDRTTWRDEKGEIVFRFAAPDAAGRREYRVVDEGADRLLVRRN